MRLLITGAAGMLGQDLVTAAAGAGVEAVPLTRAQLDISDPQATRAVVEGVAPEVVVNCAAWSDVDGAESQPEAANAINRDGAGNVARAAAASGAWTIHISSDYVFDGDKREPYVESDPARPLSAYGRSKLAGEQAVAEAAPGTHTIVRTSWLFGAGGRCFPATILQLAADRDAITVVDDQVGRPTFAGHLAASLLELSETRPEGLVHVAAAGACSWFELAQEIVATAGLDCEVRPGSTAGQGRPAQRPAYSVLGTERREAPALPDWHRGLEQYMALRAPAR